MFRFLLPDIFYCGEIQIWMIIIVVVVVGDWNLSAVGVHEES